MIARRSLWLLVVALLLVTVGAIMAFLLRAPSAAAPSATSSEQAPQDEAGAPAAKSKTQEPPGGNKPRKMEAAPGWEPLCKDYCWKMRACRVHVEGDCKESCLAVLSSGADPASHRCVAGNTRCSEISNCGF